MTVLDVKQSIEMEPQKRAEESRAAEGHRDESVMPLWATESINGRNFRRRAAIVSPSRIDHPSYQFRISQKCRPKSLDFDPLFREVDISSQQKIAGKTSKEFGSFGYYASLGLLRKPLPRKHREERMRLIALSLMQYDEEDDQHRRVAEEVNRLYTGAAFRP